MNKAELQKRQQMLSSVPTDEADDFEDIILSSAPGVDKEKGARELEKAGGLEMFKEGFTFREGGGTESIYNDEPEPVPPIRIKDHELKITRNVVIRDSTFTLGVTG